MRNTRGSHSGDGSGERGESSSSRTDRTVLNDRPARGPGSADGSDFVRAALRYIDYKPRPGGLTDFGRRVGYNGHEIPWSGAFVDCVARDVDLAIPACVYSPSGLAEFIHSRRWRSDPKPGDVVFYTFATKQTDPFGMPHVGIVTDARDWKRSKTFVAIEAQVDGSVKLVTRGKYDTLGFGRPNFKARPGRQRVQTAAFLTNPLAIKPGARGRDVLNVQLALEKVVDLGTREPAVFCARTQRAFARWQRLIGFVGADANGIPTPASLERLGTVSGIFSIGTAESQN